jgi:hypothetical protein
MRAALLLRVLLLVANLMRRSTTGAAIAHTAASFGSATQDQSELGCRFDGCSAGRSFFLGVLNLTAFVGRLPGSALPSSYTRFPSAQCVSTLDSQIACTSRAGGSPLEPNTVPGLVAFALRAQGALELSWNWTDLYNSSSLPIADLQSNIFATDGFVLLATSSNGTPLGQPVLIIPTMGPVHSLMATYNDVLVIPSLTTDIATYLNNGVPYSELWLYGTLQGVPGLYLTFSPGVVDNTNFYVPMRFAPGQGARGLPSAQCLLLAVEVRRAQVGKMEVLWNHTFVCPEAGTAQARSPAQTTLVNGTVCTVAGSAAQPGFDELLCLRDRGLFASVALSLVCNGTVLALARATHNAATTLVAVGRPGNNGSCVLVVDNDGGGGGGLAASACLDLRVPLPLELNASTLVPTCPLMTYTLAGAPVPGNGTLTVRFLAVLQAPTGSGGVVALLVGYRLTTARARGNGGGEIRAELAMDFAVDLPASSGSCRSQMLASVPPSAEAAAGASPATRLVVVDEEGLAVLG